MQEVGPEELTLLPGSEGGVAAPSVSRGPRAEGRAAAAEGDVEPIDGAEGDGGGGASGEADRQSSRGWRRCLVRRRQSLNRGAAPTRVDQN
jgi:hypothetical protein